MSANRLNSDTVYDRVQVILASAKDYAAHSVNTAQVVANWLIGREIVVDQQQGKKRAGYGKQLIAGLARELKSDGVSGYGELTLNLCRQFYLNYPDLPGGQILYAPRKESASAKPMAAILHASRKHYKRGLQSGDCVDAVDTIELEPLYGAPPRQRTPRPLFLRRALSHRALGCAHPAEKIGGMLFQRTALSKNSEKALSKIQARRNICPLRLAQ